MDKTKTWLAVIFWLLCVCFMLLVLAGLLFFIYTNYGNEIVCTVCNEVIAKFLFLIIVLSFALIASLAVVEICKKLNNNNIAFSFLGFKFENTSGFIFLWLLCFLSIIWAIHVIKL